MTSHFSTTLNLPAGGAGLMVHVQKFVGEVDAPLAEGRFQSDNFLWFFQGALNTSAGGGDIRQPSEKTDRLLA